MTQELFRNDFFSPGKVLFNTLVLDPDLPHAEQIDDSYADLLFATFPNEVGIDIEWRDETESGGEFIVSLVQNPDYWEPFRKRRCRTVDDLKTTVAEFVETARHWPKVYPLRRGELGIEHIRLNDLVIDPGKPLSEQAEALKEELFEVFVGHYALTVGWHPSHSPDGEFVIKLLRVPGPKPDPVYMAYHAEAYAPATWLPHMEKRCRSVEEMKQAVIGLIREAGAEPTEGR